MEQIAEPIRDEMIDIAFGIQSTLPRSEFIAAFSWKVRNYIRPAEIRRMVDAKRKELNLSDYLSKFNAVLSQAEKGKAKKKDGESQ